MLSVRAMAYENSAFVMNKFRRLPKIKQGEKEVNKRMKKDSKTKKVNEKTKFKNKSENATEEKR